MVAVVFNDLMHRQSTDIIIYSEKNNQRLV